MGRRMKDKDELKSSRTGSPFCFWHELRCSKSSMTNHKLCLDCSGRIVLSYDKKTHKNQTAWLHGCIDEPIPEWSVLFDGPEFHKRVSKYGKPSEEEMARAKKAQQIARGEVEEITQTLARLSLQEQANASLPNTIESLPVVSSSVPPKRKAKETKPKETKPKDTDVKAKRAAPKKKNELIQPPLPSVPAQAYESTELPLTNVEVVKIQVRKFMVGDKQYFLDAKKYKLYAMEKDSSPGKYVGRWDPQEEKMDTSFPDSDAE